MLQSEARGHSAGLSIGCTTLTFRKNGISTEMIAMSKLQETGVNGSGLR